MSQRLLQTMVAAVATGVVSGAVSGAIHAEPAQAAGLTYESDFTLTSATVADPIATAAVIFSKAPSLTQAGLFDYTIESITASFQGINYSQADLLTPSNIAFAQGLNAFLPSKYQQLLPNFLSGTTPTYTGDGDFPPADPLTYAFSAQEVSAGLSLLAPNLSPSQLSQVTAIAALFPQGGEASFSSTLIASTPGNLISSEGAPEPTTMAGLALAGLGLVGARRRLHKGKTMAPVCVR